MKMESEKPKLVFEVSEAYENYQTEHTPETFFGLIFTCRYHGNRAQRKAAEELTVQLFNPTVNREFMFGPTLGAIYNLEQACIGEAPIKEPDEELTEVK